MEEPKIKIETKESERPVIKVKNLPIGKKTDNFQIKDDNSSLTSVVSYKKSKSKKKHKKKKKEVNLFKNDNQEEMLDIYSNPKHKVKKKIIDESESENENFSEGESDVSSVVSGSVSESYYSGSAVESSIVGYNKMSWKDIESKKQEYLLKLHDLENKGIKLTRHFNMKSDLDDLKLEYERHRKIAEKNAAISFSRKMLMACVTALEYGNGRFDPFNIQLEGWSESVMENIGDYDSIFERLSEKYAGTSQMAPEFELMLSLAGSAFMFHLTKTMFNSALPGVGDIVKQNPNLMSNIAKAMSQSVSQQTRQEETQEDKKFQPPDIDISKLMGGLMSNLGKPSRPVAPEMPYENMSVPTPMDRPQQARTTDMSVYNNNDRFSDVSSDFSEGSEIEIKIPEKKKKKVKKSINI